MPHAVTSAAGGLYGDITSISGDASDVWVIDADGIFRSSDAASNWTQQTTFGGTGVSIQFVDQTHGWAVAGQLGASTGPTQLGRTTDGGSTWSWQTWPSNGGNGSMASPGLSFADDSHGWAADGLADPIVGTSDGGATWACLDSCLTGVRGVAMGSSTAGWLFGSNTDCTPIVEHSSDSGSTWSVQSTPAVPLCGWTMTAVDSNHAWVAGNGVIGTQDGGVTWTAEQLPPLPTSYTLDGWGGVHQVGISPSVSASGYWPGWNIARGIATRPDRSSGYVLDGWGGVHEFGGAASVTGNAYWPGWDIARSIAVDPCDATSASGYVLDGWGGIHPFGGAPDVVASGYWPGWDIADGLSLTCDSGYEEGVVLDRWGGLHPFTLPSKPMPATPSGAYWPGWNIARGVVVTTGSGGLQGYTLDGWGGVHPFGGAPGLAVSAYWPGWDIARSITWLGSGGGYVVDGWGGVHPFGIASPAQASGYWPGWDIARGIS